MNTKMRTTRLQHGTVLIYTTIAMVAFAGFISLAVDVGHVRMVRNQLQDAADAATRYAVVGMQTGGVNQARSNAVSIAAKNYADGTPVVLDPNNDIQFGAWDPIAKTFTPLSGSAQSGANAVRITCQRSAARGNAVALAFAGIVGKSTCDAQATSTATINTTINGFIGVNSITLQNFNIVASYDSSSNSPDRSMSWKGGEIASNGPINILDNCFVLGNIVLGPTGSLTKGLWFLLTGQQQTLPSPMYYAPASAGNAAAANNNAQIPLSTQGIDVTRGGSGKFWLNNPGDSITIPGGTYYFKEFKTNSNTTITFTGPVTLYVDGGDIDMGSMTKINVYQNRPKNLRIVQVGNGTFNIPQVDLLPADIYAPQATLQIGNVVILAGRGVFGQINVSNNGVLGAAFLYDTSLNSGNGNGAISNVQ